MAEVEKRPIEDGQGAQGGMGPPPSYGGTGEGHPPTYEEATGGRDSGVVVTSTPMFAGPPPSYTSLFGEIRQVRSDSSSTFQFLKKLFVLLAGTIGCTVALGVIMAIPISMIVIGARYKDDCPIQEKIPIYLIVGGSVGIFRNLISLCQKARSNDDDGEEKRKNPFESVLDLFLTAWFIAGNVWIYSNYQPSYNPNDGNDYCDKTLYMFAFWITTSTYILLGTICVCICCIAICAAAVDD